VNTPTSLLKQFRRKALGRDRADSTEVMGVTWNTTLKTHQLLEDHTGLSSRVGRLLGPFDSAEGKVQLERKLSQSGESSDLQLTSGRSIFSGTGKNLKLLRRCRSYEKNLSALSKPSPRSLKISRKGSSSSHKCLELVQSRTTKNADAKPMKELRLNSKRRQMVRVLSARGKNRKPPSNQQ